MAKKENANSYRSILKGTSLFGGVQLFQILVGLIRGKFVALFLGPAGMGVASLFNTSANTIQQIAGFGLNLVFVKEVAASKDDATSMRTAMTVVRSLILLTSLLGALICVLFSGMLSRLTFGTSDYTGQFMLLGLMLFFAVASQGLMSVLQGLHEVKRLTRTSIIGSAVGLATGIPLYYFFGTSGIVPAMTILSFTMCVCYAVGVHRSLPEARGERFIWQSHKPLVKKFILLGLILTASNAFGTAGQYGLNLFIRYFGALTDVGLYQAANSLTNQYAGVVFAAMMMDFFPRLSAAASDNTLVRSIVNRQLEIVALIATPMVCLLILFAPLVIRILLTSEFISTIPLMRWLAAGVLIKAIYTPLGYITFAKDNRRIFFWLEGVVCNASVILFCAAGYWFFGLAGLGYGLFADGLFCLVLYYVVNRKLYGFSVSGKALKECIVGIGWGAGTLCAAILLPENFATIVMTATALGASIWAFRGLKKRFRHSHEEAVVDDSASS